MKTKPTNKNTSPKYGWAIVGPTFDEHGKPDGYWYIRIGGYKTKRDATIGKQAGELVMKGKFVLND